MLGLLFCETVFSRLLILLYCLLPPLQFYTEFSYVIKIIANYNISPLFHRGKIVAGINFVGLLLTPYSLLFILGVLFFISKCKQQLILSNKISAKQQTIKTSDKISWVGYIILSLMTPGSQSRLEKKRNDLGHKNAKRSASASQPTEGEDGSRRN